MQIDPLASFNALIEGKSADMQIFSDRVEWSVSAGVLERATSTEIVPVDGIRSVATATAGPGKTALKIGTTGKEVELHLPATQANAAREIIEQLVLGVRSTQPEHSDDNVPS